MSRVQFIVVEPSAIIRKGLVSLINELPNAVVIREAESANKLVELATHHSAIAIVINANLLKQMPAHDVKKLVQRKKKIFIIGLAKTEEEIESTIEGLPNQLVFLNDSKSTIINKFKTFLTLKNDPILPATENTDLSNREKEILKDVALGFSNKEIADKNFISPHTVITHRKNITRKLGIKTVSGLTIYAVINKLIGMEEFS